jgi:hypothetical protein
VFSILSGDLWSEDMVIVEEALNQLSKLCREDKQNMSIFSLTGYCPVCGVIRKWYHNREVLIAGFRLLQLATESCAVGAFGCGALESIVCAMENFETDCALQAAACGALATIVSTSKSGPSIKLAIDLSGSSVLIKAMQSFPDSIQVQQKAIMTFLCMARFPQVKEHLEVASDLVRESMEKLGMTSLSPPVEAKEVIRKNNTPAARGA